AERDIVAERVELRAELALRPEQPRDASVEPVEHSGEDHRSQRLLPVVADRQADTRETKAQRQRRDRIGDHGAERDPAWIPVVVHWLRPVSVASTPTSAIIVSPAI